MSSCSARNVDMPYEIGGFAGEIRHGRNEATEIDCLQDDEMLAPCSLFLDRDDEACADDLRVNKTEGIRDVALDATCACFARIAVAVSFSTTPLSGITCFLHKDHILMSFISKEGWRE